MIIIFFIDICMHITDYDVHLFFFRVMRESKGHQDSRALQDQQ